MKVRLVVLTGLLAKAAGESWAVAAPPTRNSYLELARAAYPACVAAARAEVDRFVRDYQPQPEWGYAPPGGPVWLAGLAASLYELTHEESYAQDAAGWLAEHHRFKEYCPEWVRLQRPEYADGLPTLTDFFHLSVFAEAYARIRNSPSVTAAQRAQIEQNIADSADFVLNFPEWGPMNRAMLRAEGLVLAAKALPDHPQAATWRKLAGVLASDSWGRWSEEDAQIYHPIWLYSLMRYADAVGDRSFFDLVTTRYYFDYFLHLLAPIGTVPEFGDARWNESWPLYLVCFERGATEYRRPDLKWAARQVFERLVPSDPAKIGARTALVLTDACRWADDGLAPVEPPARSEEVLEDLVGKKVVFRNGWGPEATYLLLNYRDEGDFALTPRDFLRHTIPVEEEKMHHGHADENGICLLMSGGSVLLNEAGYRDRMPSGPYGAYRADYFHNRLIVRPEKRERDQPLLEFLRYSGSYHSVRTQKIDFFNFADADVSRTRLSDEQRGYQSDRLIVYLRRDNLFLVFDIVKILRTGYYTLATLWHATTIVDHQPGYYVTAIETLGDRQLPQTQALLIDFLQQGRRADGTYPIRRSHQDEIAVYQTVASHYLAGQIETFVTALWPLPRGQSAGPLVEKIRLLDAEPPGDGVGAEIRYGEDDVRYVCVKTDLSLDILGENLRPRYSYESGAVRYGPLETDASVLCARRTGERLSYSAANMVKILFNDQVVFAARPSTFTLQPDDLSTGHGPPKWRYWEDSIELR